MFELKTLMRQRKSEEFAEIFNRLREGKHTRDDILRIRDRIIQPSSHIWFEKQPLGKNSLGSFMKSMSEAAGLSGKHTNHSVRRTMISTLRKENVEPLNIIALAGQRNLKSLDSYSSTSTKQQKLIT